jgi:hypothetical protein
MKQNLLEDKGREHITYNDISYNDTYSPSTYLCNKDVDKAFQFYGTIGGIFLIAIFATRTFTIAMALAVAFTTA